MDDNDLTTGLAFRQVRPAFQPVGHPVWGMSKRMPGLFDQFQIAMLDQEERYLMSTGQALSQRERALRMADLRRFNGKIQEILHQAVTIDGALYSLHRNGVYVFGVDAEGNATEDRLFIDARVKGGQEQVQEARDWYDRAIVGRRSLSEQPELRSVPTHPKPEPPQGQRLEDRSMGREFIEEHSADWTPYVNSSDVVDGRFEQRAGGRYRCTDCVDSTEPFETDNRRSLAAHWRMKHDRSELMDSPLTRDKATETRRSNRYARDINLAIELLTGSLGKVPPTEEVIALRQENADLKARLALIQEAMGV